jgi:pyrroline-5-carboxylate reductase
MKIANKVAFIGAGNMAGALIQGLLAQKTCPAEQIMASDPRGERLQELHNTHGIQTTQDNRQAAGYGDLVVLSTKPQVLVALLPEIASSIRRESLVLSIAAGVPLAVIESQLGKEARVVRAMPNTPALVGAGATGLAAGARATAEDVALAESVFASVGVAVSVPENLLDAVTGLSGSGPAYVFVIVETLADAGVEMGLSRAQALLLAAQTVFGSAKLVMQTGEHPARLKDQVASPGGTTIAGLQALEAGGIRKALADAVRAATRRARELGEQTTSKLSASGHGGGQLIP